MLVDEYQDTNALQADIVALLRPDSTGITAVGDDAQAIYGFRAASVRNILDFEERHPATDVVTLTRNYRSTGPILSATNADHRRGQRAAGEGPVDRAHRRRAALARHLP